VSRQRDPAEHYMLAIGNRVVHMNRRIGELASKSRIGFSTAFEHTDLALARIDLRSGQFLKRGLSRDVVVVRLIVEEYLDVGDLESKLLHTCANHGRSIFVPAVQKEMTLGRHDKYEAMSSVPT
jgi:hypothetical protein